MGIRMLGISNIRCLINGSPLDGDVERGAVFAEGYAGPRRGSMQYALGSGRGGIFNIECSILNFQLKKLERKLCVFAVFLLGDLCVLAVKGRKGSRQSAEGREEEFLMLNVRLSILNEEIQEKSLCLGVSVVCLLGEFGDLAVNEETETGETRRRLKTCVECAIITTT
jgi:hypothetical protein